MRPIARADGQPVPGIVDTLAAGFGAINRAPWLVLIPIVIDLFLWLGPRISIAPLADRVFGAMLRLLAQATPASGPALEQASQLERQIEAARAAAQAVNLLSLLAFSGFTMSTAVPSAMSGGGGRLEIASAALALLLVVVLLGLGIAIGCIWLGTIAQQVRDGAVSASRLARTAPKYWLAIVGFLGLILAVLLGIGVPLSIIATVAQLVAPALAAFLGLFAAVALWVAIMWSVVYLFFFTAAIVISDVGPITAARNSVRLVGTNLWSALGFIVITWVIVGGMGVIWGSLSTAPAGLVVSIVGNGYIQSGLAAASMLFYRNRISRLAR